MSRENRDRYARGRRPLNITKGGQLLRTILRSTQPHNQTCYALGLRRARYSVGRRVLWNTPYHHSKFPLLRNPRGTCREATRSSGGVLTHRLQELRAIYGVRRSSSRKQHGLSIHRRSSTLLVRNTTPYRALVSRAHSYTTCCYGEVEKSKCAAAKYGVRMAPTIYHSFWDRLCVPVKII